MKLRLKKCNLCCTKISDFAVKKGGTVILENINLHIHCGDLTALIGPNGAGKSTLLKAILGEIPHEGTLYFIDEKDKKMREPNIGYVPQTLEFDRTSPISVRDLFDVTYSNLPLWIKRDKKTTAVASKALERVEAEELIDKKLGALSGGELQRVMLALALNPMPDILLLDEPVSGVDRRGMDLFYETVSKLRKSYDLTIILISHDFEAVKKYANKVILLDKRILKQGKPEEVFNSKEFNEAF